MRQKLIDVINMETGRLKPARRPGDLNEVGTGFPLWEQILSVYDGSTVRKVNRAMDHPGGEGTAVTFAGLIEKTGFIKQMKDIMQVLRETFGMPMDLEFANDGKDLYILQCRPQSHMEEQEQVQIPKWIPEKNKLFYGQQIRDKRPGAGHPNARLRGPRRIFRCGLVRGPGRRWRRREPAECHSPTAVLHPHGTGAMGQPGRHPAGRTRHLFGHRSYRHADRDRPESQNRPRPIFRNPLFPGPRGSEHPLPGPLP